MKRIKVAAQGDRRNVTSRQGGHDRARWEVKRMTSEVLGADARCTFAALAAHVGAVEHELDDQEKRIKSLEDDRLRVKAWAALLALLASVGGFLFGKLWPR